MLIILLGPSGSGKTTIEKNLEESGINRLRSHTTRPKKLGEAEDAYYFMNNEEFKKADIVESVLYKNYFFGLSRAEVKKAETQDCVVTLDWSGAQQIKRLFPFAATVYLDCPLYQLEKRLPPQLDREKHMKMLEQIEIDSRYEFDCDYIINNYDGQLDAATTEILELYRTYKNVVTA
ncbi:MAG: guanylate kinase [Sporomusaceae bacterium]|nr:guanylate kinase [Sporomusaceae bacterium]